LLARVVRAAGVTSPASPHTLRRTFCTAGLISGVPLRGMQYAMRHADARTTIRYDMARANLDRHAAHSVAAYLAGMGHRLTGSGLLAGRRPAEPTLMPMSGRVSRAPVADR
jgi:hypothetical protein